MLPSAETRLVTLCVREPEALDWREFHAAAAAVRDWDALLATAKRHWVPGYVRRAVAREGISLPTQVDDSLRQQTMALTLVVLQLNALFKRVLAALEQAGVPVIVLKGPALAPTIYPETALRPYCDVDVVVDARHEAAAAAVLQGCGLRETPLTAEAAGRVRAAAWVGELATMERSFQIEGALLGVELHVDPLQLFLKPTAEAARWARAVPVPGLPWARMLGAEDQLVQLSVHAHRHGFDRLLWVKDVDLLLRANAGGFDWEVAIATARQEGVQASVWYALRLAEALLHTPVPPAALARLGPTPLLRAMYQAVWPTAVLGHSPVFFDRQALRVVRRLHWSSSGPLPSLVLIGRRRERARALVRLVRYRKRIGVDVLPHLMPNYFGSPSQLKAAVAETLSQALGRPARSLRGKARTF